MNRFDNITGGTTSHSTRMPNNGNQMAGYKPLMWLVALLLTAVVVGCGGQDPILGGGGAGAIAGAPPNAIIPGGLCTVASGPTIPTVTLSNPISGNQNVTISTTGVANSGKEVTATFSLAMNAATINTTTFTLKPVGGAVLTPASVGYNAVTKVATLTTAAALIPNTSYTAIITVGAITSAGGIPIACSYAWNFKTAVAAVPLAINLGTAASFGIASRAGMTSTGVTVINGNVALFPLGTCTDATGAPANCLVESKPASATGLTVNGLIRFPTDSDSGATASAVTTDLTAAWTEGFNKVDTFATGFLVGQLAGKTLLPGVYNEANLGLAASGIVTFDAQNDPNAIFIVKVGTVGGAGDFTDSGTLLNPTQVLLANQAQARNIWFIVGRDITIGHGTTWEGNILAGRSATILDGSTVNGRVLGGAGGAGAIVLTGAAAPSVTTITVP